MPTVGRAEGRPARRALALRVRHSTRTDRPHRGQADATGRTADLPDAPPGGQLRGTGRSTQLEQQGAEAALDESRCSLAGETRAGHWAQLPGARNANVKCTWQLGVEPGGPWGPSHSGHPHGPVRASLGTETPRGGWAGQAGHSQGSAMQTCQPRDGQRLTVPDGAGGQGPGRAGRAPCSPGGGYCATTHQAEHFRCPHPQQEVLKTPTPKFPAPPASGGQQPTPRDAQGQAMGQHVGCWLENAPCWTPR